MARGKTADRVEKFIRGRAAVECAKSSKPVTPATSEETKTPPQAKPNQSQK